MSGASGGAVPVLLYHRVASDEAYAALTGPERVYSVAESRFHEHLDALDAAGWRAVSADALVAHVRGERALGPRHLLLSFDDGCASVVARALPALAERGLPALLFVVTDLRARLFQELPESERRVSDDEIRALDAAGVAIGSHSASHRPLTGLDAALLDNELGGSRRALEEVLGKPVTLFGVPYGIYGAEVRAAAERAGYGAVFTSEVGVARPGDDPLAIPRLNVSGTLDGDGLLAMLRPSAIARRRLVRAVKRLPPHLIGAERWMRLRRRLRATQASPLRSDRDPE